MEKTILTNQELDKVLNGLEVRLYSKIINDSLWLIPDNFNVKHASFISCDFKQKIVLKSLSNLIGLKFEDCEFHGGLEIDNIVILEDIKKPILGDEGLKIKKCTFYENSKIKIKDTKYSIEIIENTFKQNIVFIGGGKTEIKLEKYKLIGNHFEGLINIRDITSILVLKGNKHEKTCRISTENIKPTLSNIELESGNYNEGLHILGTKNKNYKNKDGNTVAFENEIGYFKVYCSEQLSGNIFLSNTAISSIELSGINTRSNFSFINIEFDNLIFSSFTNVAQIQFFSIKPKENSNLNIQKSNLGKTFFLSSDLNRFSKISIFESLIQDIVSSDTEWFDPKKLARNEDKKEDFRNNREVFRQLKLAFEKQGDKIRSLQFKAEEYKSFNKELKENKWWEKWNDRFILLLSRTNSHGQNWIKPLFILIFITIIFGFVLFVIDSTKLDFRISIDIVDIKKTLSEFWYNKKIVVEILNPIHSLTGIFGLEKYLSGWLYGIDIIYRVIYAFFIFQIVSAFRKYIK